MNQIASLLPLDNVVADLDASSKKRVFEQAGILFENHQSVARSTVYNWMTGQTVPQARYLDEMLRAAKLISNDLLITKRK